MKIPLKAPLAAFAVWLVLVFVAGPATTGHLFPVVVFLLAAALSYGWWKTRFTGSPKMKPKEFPEEERAWLKSVRKTWVTSLDLVGLVVWHPGKTPELPKIPEAPQIISCRPVPLGVEMEIQIVAGRQSQASWLAVRENLASAWGREVRIVPGANPRRVVVTVEFGSPLEDSRDSEDSGFGEVRDA